jgi:hypothetical protein
MIMTLNEDWEQWLTPVILTTQEAEIKRIAVPCQPEKVHKTPSQLMDEHSCTCLPSQLYGKGK